MGAGEEKFDGFLVEGKFTDDSVASNWKLKINNIVVDIAEFTDPITKEFSYISKVKPISLLDAFRVNSSGNQYIERVDTLIGTDEVKNFRYGFYVCPNLVEADLSLSNTSNVNDFKGLFTSCSKLLTVNLNNLNTESAIDLSSMFSGCSKIEALDLSHFVVDNVEDISVMFQSCTNLETLILPNFSGSKIKSLFNLFHSCTKIKHLDISTLDTSLVTSFQGLIYKCESLESIIVNWDLSNVRSFLNWAFNCKSLKSIEGSIRNIKVSIDLSFCPLSNESAMLFIEGLADVEVNQTITFRKSTFDSLSEDQVGIAERKNWTVKGA